MQTFSRRFTSEALLTRKFI